MKRKHNFLFAAEAKSEIQESYDWYESRLPNLGDRFLADLSNCLDRIDANPRMYKVVYRNHRQAQLSTFPFVIFYQIVDTAIIVLSVFHTSRNREDRMKD